MGTEGRAIPCSLCGGGCGLGVAEATSPRSCGTLRIAAFNVSASIITVTANCIISSLYGIDCQMVFPHPLHGFKILLKLSIKGFIT